MESFENNKYGLPVEGEFPYTDTADTLDEEIDNIWNKLNFKGSLIASKNRFAEIIQHFINWEKNRLMTNAVSGKVSGEVQHMGKKRVTVSIPYFETDCLSVGNKVKAIVIKD